MADYYPLLSRAVAGLERNTGEARRSLYERARSALVNQLNSVSPALPVAEITRERLGLEEAIRRVEAEAAERARTELPPEFMPSPQPPESEPELPPEEPGEPMAAPHDDAWAVEPPRAQKPPPPKLTERGLKGYREIMGEADELGEATAKAAESAREFYENIPGVGATPRPRESFEQRREHEPYRREAQPVPPHDLDQPLAGAPPEEVIEPYREPRSYGRLIMIVVALLIVAGLGSLVYWQRSHVASVYASVVAALPGRSSAPPQPPAQPQQRPKISDRIGPSGGQQESKSAGSDAAQKVVLIEEDPSDPQGKRYVGSVLWRTETVSPGPGLAPELAIRADMEIPERKMHITFSLRRNTDKALPASHTVEIMFTVPPDFDGGGITNVPGLLMKQAEAQRGVPLAGLSVKVTDNYFLIGLSAVEADVQRNVQLLK